MSKTKEISIRCLHCQKWFPSPIFFGDSESFDTSTLFGNLAQCPHCGHMTGCNKENFRARFEDGGFLGVETNDEETVPSTSLQNRDKKIGRNDPCHCGSGKKYKKCHGALI